MLSPDGSQIVIATGQVQTAQLQLRRLDSTEANILTGGGYDPITQTAELKVCPVRVERAEGPSGG